MADRIPRSEFAATFALPDWRILLHSIEAWFVAPSFAEGAAFITSVADAADAADHHPDVELRYPGRVHVRLSSHDVGGLSQRDARLAATISEIAATAGMASEPRRSSRVEVAIDASDINLVRPFWNAVLDYEDEPPAKPGDLVDGIRDRRGIGPSIWFQQMDEPRSQRNRLHVDIVVPDDELADRLAAALVAGGTLLSDREAPAFWVLADPEGNEACLCTWQGRD